MDTPDPAKKKIGRPAHKLPPTVLEKIGDPPDDPLKRAEWSSNAMAHVINLQMRGEIPPNYAAALRTSLRALSQMTPTHTISRVRDNMKDRDRAVATDQASPPIEAPRAGNPIRE